MIELREGARVTFTDAETAKFYSMPPDTVGTVIGWRYFEMGEKRVVVDCDVNQPLYLAWVKPGDLKVLRR